MPVRQWLEERRIMQAEMQRLKEKLAISERTAKAESQLKVIYFSLCKHIISQFFSNKFFYTVFIFRRIN